MSFVCYRSCSQIACMRQRVECKWVVVWLDHTDSSFSHTDDVSNFALLNLSTRQKLLQTRSKPCQVGLGRCLRSGSAGCCQSTRACFRTTSTWNGSTKRVSQHRCFCGRMVARGHRPCSAFSPRLGLSFLLANPRMLSQTSLHLSQTLTAGVNTRTYLSSMHPRPLDFLTATHLDLMDPAQAVAIGTTHERPVQT